MVEICRRVTRSKKFSIAILLLIVLSGILVGLETYPEWHDGTPRGDLLQFVQNVILLVFVLEILMKIVACGKQPWRYFQDSWNLFDFVVVAVCLLQLQSASVVRMARILRTMRMITVLPRLRILVSALLRSIPSLGYIGVLLGLHFYIYSVIGTIAFGKNDPIRFGSLHTTATTLFQVLTLEGWNDVRDTQVMGSDVTYEDNWKSLASQHRKSQPQPVIATVYFVSFILLGTMIMLNLFTGVIISSMEEAQLESATGEVDGVPVSDHGYLTLHEELNLVTTKLHHISLQLARMQEAGAWGGPHLNGLHSSSSQLVHASAAVTKVD